METEIHIMPKVSGYLEKKGRKKMMSCYKKYWFVLEGRLLLYYKSKDEYDAISPCKGSINLGPTCNVKPCSANIGVFQIESKTTTITLRAETREEQHKWMQAIMSALNQNNNATKLSHFRYSLGELTQPPKKPPLERQNTFPERFTNSSPKPNMKIIEKLQKIGAHTYGIGPKLQRSKTTLERQKQMSFSDESLSTTGNNMKKDRVFRKTESVILENEEYGKLLHSRCANSMENVEVSSEGIYERIPSNDSVFVTKENEQTMSVLVNNPAYCSITRTKSSIMADDEIYTEPGDILKLEGRNVTNENESYLHNIQNKKNCEQERENIDYNDNNVRGEKISSPSSKKTENIYCEADCASNKNTRSSVEYDDIAQYAEISPRNSSLSSQGSSEEKEKKLFKGFGKKNKNQKDKPEEKKIKLRKSESFLQRVWLKKTKNKKNKKEIPFKKDHVLEKLHMPEDNIKMLNTLQDNFLLSKIALQKLHDGEDASHCIKEQEHSMIYHEVLVDDTNNAHNPSNEDPPCPLLPPRNQKQTCLSPYHDVPRTQPMLPPKKKKNEFILLDDILEDLNKQAQLLRDKQAQEHIEEEQKGEGKVKALIKRFSIGKEEGVEIRRKNTWKINSEAYCTDSGELDNLLEELAKVTTAPIMTPGVTTSLINPEICDRELLKLVAIRKRRKSEPDYDIPRSHRSLTNIPKRDDNALQATRFFGPILKPSDLETYATNRPPTPTEDYDSNVPSIAPDSLEVEYDRLDLSHDENRNISYHSHDYLGFNKRSHSDLQFFVDNNLYSDSRLLYKSRNDYPGVFPQGRHFNRIEDSENVFVDSLEA